MQPFYPIDHTADIGIVAQGHDLRELCENAARGMISLVAETDSLEATSEHHLDVTAPTDEQLLMALLRELHFLHETEYLLFAAVTVESCEGGRLRATARAAPLAGAEDHVLNEIKAVTYHGLDIHRDGDVLKTQIIFDT
ncbi:MAG: archease [Armatimonadota bacterium]|jgi:SHS2 domain-containing protein